MSGKDKMADPNLKPILFRKGALGHNLPQRDMLLLPNHRLGSVDIHRKLMTAAHRLIMAA